MKIRFTFRSDFFDLPNPEEIFEFVRALTNEFEKKPYETFSMIEREVVPMGQLQCGLYFSFKSKPEKLFKRFSNKEKNESLKLEMSWPIPGMIRVETEIDSECEHQFTNSP